MTNQKLSKPASITKNLVYKDKYSIYIKASSVLLVRSSV